jgi:hypothetical protein
MDALDASVLETAVQQLGQVVATATAAAAIANRYTAEYAEFAAKRMMVGGAASDLAPSIELASIFSDLSNASLKYAKAATGALAYVSGRQRKRMSVQC